MASCNVNSLLADAACFNCLTPYQLGLVQAQLLCNIEAAGGGGGGGGAVAAEGANYCITGTAPTQVFKLKNLDTGLANRIDAVGADGVQTTQVDVGSAC